MQRHHHDIYAAVDLAGFAFSRRSAPFDWRLLHGVDPDELARSNDVAALERLIPALRRGSADAEPEPLSAANWAQLVRLASLAVEHLWLMREAHARLYPAYAAAVDAAERWTDAAGEYLSAGAALLNALHGDDKEGSSEEPVAADGGARVAAAREALAAADAAYERALGELERRDAAARARGLRRHRVAINWRAVFSVDVAALVVGSDDDSGGGGGGGGGGVAALERLLPVVAYGCVMGEGSSGGGGGTDDRQLQLQQQPALTARHYRQLLALAQACLDYLWAICAATSAALEERAAALADASARIPALTAATEELRRALMMANEAMLISGCGRRGAAAPAAAGRVRSPSLPLAGGAVVRVRHQHGGSRRSSPSPHPSASIVLEATTTTTAAAAHACHHCCSCHCGTSAPLAAALRPPPAAAALCPSSGGGGALAAVLTPAAGGLRGQMDSLEQELRLERERTDATRRALEDAAAMLEKLPIVAPPPPPPPPPPPLVINHHHQPQQQPAVSPPPPPHTVNVPVTISLDRGSTGGGAAPGSSSNSPRCGGSAPSSPAGGGGGAVCVVVDEDPIRAHERDVAAGQLAGHIERVVMGSKLERAQRAEQRATASSRSAFDSRRASASTATPTVSIRSVRSVGGGGEGGGAAALSWGDYAAAGVSDDQAAAASMMALPPQQQRPLAAALLLEAAALACGGSFDAGGAGGKGFGGSDGSMQHVARVHAVADDSSAATTTTQPAGASGGDGLVTTQQPEQYRQAAGSRQGGAGAPGSTTGGGSGSGGGGLRRLLRSVSPRLFNNEAATAAMSPLRGAMAARGGVA